MANFVYIFCSDLKSFEGGDNFKKGTLIGKQCFK